ncbi:MAG: FliH/SctL family protein [Balneolales bacterium]
MNNDRPNGIKIGYESLFRGHGVVIHEEQTNDLNAKVHEIYTRDQVDQVIDKKKEEWKKEHSIELELARKNSFSQGEQEGQLKEQKKMEGSIASLMAAMEEADLHMNKLLTEIKPYIATMVFDLAEKVIELPVNNEELQQRVTDQVQEIIDQFAANAEISIEVSGYDFDVIRTMVEESRRLEFITLKDSEELNPGEFRINTQQEQIIKEFRESLQDFRDSVFHTNKTDTKIAQ